MKEAKALTRNTTAQIIVKLKITFMFETTKYTPKKLDKTANKHAYTAANNQ